MAQAHTQMQAETIQQLESLQVLQRAVGMLTEGELASRCSLRKPRATADRPGVVGAECLTDNPPYVVFAKDSWIECMAHRGGSGIS